jgi:hypothetical protein
MQISFTFLAPVNIYIDIKQKFCSGIRVLRARMEVFLPRIAKIRPRTGFLVENAIFFCRCNREPCFKRKTFYYKIFHLNFLSIFLLLHGIFHIQFFTGIIFHFYTKFSIYRLLLSTIFHYEIFTWNFPFTTPLRIKSSPPSVTFLSANHLICPIFLST